jgi:hypothetical protein
MVIYLKKKRRRQAMRDEQIAVILDSENEEFKKLHEEHRSLDNLLNEFTQKRYLSPEEEMEKKRIQKLKLQKKDRMAEIIARYRRDLGRN